MWLDFKYNSNYRYLNFELIFSFSYYIGCKRIYNKAPMQTLARELVESLWREARLLQDKQFSDHVKTFLFEAAKMGNAELLIIVIRSYPDLLWTIDGKCRSIFHIAVLHRQKTVFNLIYEIGAIKDMILTYVDDKNQNILHLAGQLAPPSQLNMVSGAAFQMQWEMLWFKVGVCLFVLLQFRFLLVANMQGAHL